MAKWARSGHGVRILIMAEGATSRDVNRDRNARSTEISALAKAAQNSGDILGVRCFTLLDFPDNRMDSVDRLDVVKAIESQIEKYYP